MAFSALIGALRVALRLDSAEYVEGLKASKAELREAARDLNATARQMSTAGRQLTLGLTAPILGVGVAAVKTAGDFEAAMIRVGISTKATAGEMAQLEAAARKIGKDTVFSASEAADAMDMLAKTGVGVADILGGAAKATVDLAAATGSQLEPASAAISDSMQQFALSAGQLPGVVNQITGAVNESKLSFEDFTQASGQAGGVAAALGVSFEDFNAVLAGTSSLFTSGSDAGTSFKTFLTALTPKSNEAAAAIKAYGLSFFEANGNLRSMADIAEQLRTKLSGLSDEAKTQVLKDIFGTDAMRTAIALMNQGSAGLELLKTRIQETDAAAQAAKRMEGLNGQLKQLGGSAEELAIAFGKTGVLQVVTGLISGMADLLDKVTAAPPALISVGAAALGAAASVGPLLSGVGLLQKGMAGAALAMSKAGEGAGLLRVGLAALGGFIGPGGLILLGLTAAAAAALLLAKHFAEQKVASAEVTKQATLLNDATADYARLTNQAATASGKAKVKFLEEAEAKRQLAIQTRKDTVAKLDNARATLAQLKAESAQAIAAERFSARGDAAGTIKPVLNQGKAVKAQANIAALEKAVEDADRRMAEAEAAIKAVQEAGSAGGNGNPPTVDTGGGSGRSALNRAEASDRAVAEAASRELDARMALTADIAKLAALREQEIRDDLAQANNRLRQDAAEGQITKAAADKAAALNAEAAESRLALVRREAAAALEDGALRTAEAREGIAGDIARIEAELAGSAAARAQVEARALAERQATEAQRMEFELRQQVVSGEITQADADLLLTKQAELQAAEQAAQSRAHRVAAEREAADRAEGALELQIDLLRAQGDAADLATDKVVIDEKILALQQQLERLKLEEIVASSASTDIEKELAKARLALLGVIHQSEREAQKGSPLQLFEQTASALDGLRSAVSSHDWVGAFRQLDNAIALLRKASGQAATSMDKLSAAAAVASVAGGVVGGKAGSAISGAAGGAVAGAQLGSIVPGVGTAIGAVVGGILGGLGGLFGGKSAKKQAKAQAKAQAAAEAQRKAEEEAATKRKLEIELMRLAGDEAAARAAEEADLLKTMSASNAELQKEVWAKQKAADLVAQQRQLEVELAQAMGDTATETRLLREDALKALPPELRAAKQAIFDVIDATKAREEAEARFADLRAGVEDKVARARDQVADAAEREIDQLTEVRDRFRDLARGLADVRKELKAGPLAGLDIRAQARAAEREFNRLSAAAQTGDQEALAALPDAIRTFAQTQGQVATSRSQLNAQLAKADKAAEIAESAANNAASDADRQIAELERIRDVLGGVKDVAVTMASAEQQLIAAILEQSATMRAIADQSAALAASVPAQVQTAVASLTDSLNAFAIDTSGFDAGAAAAAVDATSGLSAVAGGDPSDIGQQVADALEPMLAQATITNRKLLRIQRNTTQGSDRMRVEVVDAA